MKKFLLLFILVISLILTGCGKKTDELASNEVILEGIKYTLNQDDNEYGIKYKVASNFRKTSLINAINYSVKQ